MVKTVTKAEQRMMARCYVNAAELYRDTIGPMGHLSDMTQGWLDDNGHKPVMVTPSFIRAVLRFCRSMEGDGVSYADLHRFERLGSEG